METVLMAAAEVIGRKQEKTLVGKLYMPANESRPRIKAGRLADLESVSNSIVSAVLRMRGQYMTAAAEELASANLLLIQTLRILRNTQ